MRGVIDALRRLIGIFDYSPGVTPHAIVRKPTWHGSRGRNDYQMAWPLPAQALIVQLTQEQRLIRQMIADASRHWNPVNGTRIG